MESAFFLFPFPFFFLFGYYLYGLALAWHYMLFPPEIELGRLDNIKGIFNQI